LQSALVKTININELQRDLLKISGTRASHLFLLPNPRLQPTWLSARCHRWRVFLQPRRIVEVGRYLFCWPVGCGANRWAILIKE
jgi:hypothetical protein